MTKRQQIIIDLLKLEVTDNTGFADEVFHLVHEQIGDIDIMEHMYENDPDVTSEMAEFILSKQMDEADEHANDLAERTREFEDSRGVR